MHWLVIVQNRKKQAYKNCVTQLELWYYFANSSIRRTLTAEWFCFRRSAFETQRDGRGRGGGTRECSRRHAPVDGLSTHLVTGYELKSHYMNHLTLCSTTHVPTTQLSKPASTKSHLLNETRPVQTFMRRRQRQRSLVCMRATYMSIQRIKNV